ncbi:MAG: hypothetical protein ACO1RA_14430 [Planctomycetaceae bacterium]
MSGMQQRGIGRWAIAMACLFCHVAFGFGAMVCGAEGEGSAPGGSALGVRQERVELMTADLQKRFATLIQTIQKTDPAKAERLQATLEEAKKLQLTDRMKAIVGMLDDASLDKASDGQKQLLDDIRTLLVLLLDEKSDREKAREEYERLEKWKAELESLIRSQEEQRRESEKLSDKDATLRDLAAKIAAVEKLIGEQKDLVQKTEAARGEGRDAIAKLGGSQEKVREATEALAEEVAGKPAGGEAKPEKKAGDGGKESGSEPKPAKEGDSGKEGGGKKEEENGSESKPTEGGGSESKPSEGGGSEAKPSEGGGAKSPPQPGEAPLKAAAQQQKQAEQSLDKGKAKQAAEQEQGALAQLERALAELKKEEQRIVSLPKEQLKKMAAQQDQLREKTAELEKQMKESAKSSGKPNAGGSKSPPGEKSLGDSQKSMQDASKELGEDDASDAERKQRQAKRELEKALEEIEERLNQLREETQIEKLAKLEARFRDMLSRQQKLTQDTRGLEERRKGGEKLSRMVYPPLTRDERQLAESAQQAVDILLEDGTSIVFPDVVEQLRDDLLTVAKLLDSKRTDSYTLGMQEEIEDQLEELILALEKAQEQKEAQGGGGGGGGGGGNESLLPNSAELKLLRLAQMRVNRRTRSLDAAREEGGLDDTLKQEVHAISERQSELSEMTLRITQRSAE